MCRAPLAPAPGLGPLLAQRHAGAAAVVTPQAGASPAQGRRAQEAASSCNGRDLAVVEVVPAGATGIEAVTLHLEDRAPSACLVGGYPRLEGTLATGRHVALSPFHGVPPWVPPKGLRAGALRPGATAFLVLFTSDECTGVGARAWDAPRRWLAAVQLRMPDHTTLTAGVRLNLTCGLAESLLGIPDYLRGTQRWAWPEAARLTGRGVVAI
jgi:hypothetical protein